MIVTLEQYWMGRDVAYAHELTAEIRANAEDLVGKMNLVLAFAEADGVEPGIDQVTHTPIASGWRPRGVNARTANAGQFSTHIDGNGGDLQDQLTRSLAAWCLANADALKQAELWMERPQWTAGADPWVHWQRVPPKSGKRFYIPSSAPPRAAPLPGEEQFA